MPVDAPAVQPVLVGVEPTLHAAVAVSAPRLPGLETTEEVLGDVSIPGEDEPLARPVRCRRCGTPAAADRPIPDPPGASRCPACGERMDA